MHAIKYTRFQAKRQHIFNQITELKCIAYYDRLWKSSFTSPVSLLQHLVSFRDSLIISTRMALPSRDHRRMRQNRQAVSLVVRYLLTSWSSWTLTAQWCHLANVRKSEYRYNLLFECFAIHRVAPLLLQSTCSATVRYKCIADHANVSSDYTETWPSNFLNLLHNRPHNLTDMLNKVSQNRIPGNFISFQTPACATEPPRVYHCLF